MGSVHKFVQSISSVGANLSDQQLLEAILYRTDDQAFAELVRRYGPMVFGVCCRILRHGPDAEDAFQSTFMVLLQKAGTILHRAYLGSWLHGVAHRTAQEARRKRTLRRHHETQPKELPANPFGPELDIHQNEMLEVLDQELDKLPEKYRSAIVLCDLQQKSRKEAASQLDIPEGTLSARLTRGRQRLAQRLKSKGFALGGMTCSTIWCESIRGYSESHLMPRFTPLAITSTPPSHAVQTLVQGVLWKMKLYKLILGVVGVLLCALIVGVAGYALHTPTEAPNETTDNPQPQPADDRTPLPKPKTNQPEERSNRPQRNTSNLQAAGRSKPFQRKAEALELMKMPFPTKGLQDGLRLGDLLELFQTHLQQEHAKTGKDNFIAIVVDLPAFKIDSPDVNVLESEVKYPRFPEKMSIDMGIRYALDQLVSRNATYLFRDGAIIVTTYQKASIDSLLRIKPVISFSDVKLTDALEQLEYKTGASITIDPRVGKKGEMTISATFTNNVSLDSILVMLTEMADLKMVTIGSGIYITTPAKATKILEAKAVLQELDDREKRGVEQRKQFREKNNESKQLGSLLYP